jgi:hypothetical protein
MQTLAGRRGEANRRILKALVLYENSKIHSDLQVSRHVLYQEQFSDMLHNCILEIY